MDFGIAHYERAEGNSKPEDALKVDYPQALEYFGQALRQDPQNLAALYDRAVVEGKLSQFEGAIADLEAFLRRETDPGWKAEAQRLLEQLRNRRGALFGPSPNAAPELRAESDLESAMTGGLSANRKSPSAALAALASTLAAAHRDPWLRDAAELPVEENTLAALEALARVRVTAGGAYDSLSNAIRTLQAANLPAPLRVWRDYELLYRTTRTPAVAECGDTDALARSAARYPWFAAQIWLESSPVLRRQAGFRHRRDARDAGGAHCARPWVPRHHDSSAEIFARSD